MTDRLAVTPEEAAEMIGVSRTRIYQLLQRGAIPSLRLGKVRRIRVERIREYLEREEAQQAGEPVPASTPVPLHSGGRRRG